MRYVNRQRGAGTRVLLDHELGRLGLEPEAIDGYTREEPTHLAVAAAVAAGRVDAGLGVMSAARAFGLGFVPVAREPFDLVMAPGEPAVAPLLALLADGGFKAAVEELGGYSTAETGRVVVRDELRLGRGRVLGARNSCCCAGPGARRAGRAPAPARRARSRRTR